VLFQSDYHLKELSMGEYEQPVVGMKSCFDFSEAETADREWNAREWFVVNKAEVLLSEDSVLVPRVAMGVQAREQEETPTGMVDKLVTRPDHPLVKYAEEFTKNFDLIAERKSVIYHLRELAKASVLAKFLDDNNTSLEEEWFKLASTEPKGCRLEVPQLWNERCCSRIEVEDGRILDAEEGIGKARHGVYGGVQFGLEEVVVSGEYRQKRRDMGRMLPEFMTIRMPRPGPRLPQGVDLSLSKFDLSAPTKAAAEDPAGSWGFQSADGGASLGAAFWSSVDGGSEASLREEDRSLLRAVYNPHLSDRREEGNHFVPPDASAAYVRNLRQLVAQEAQVRAQRKERFLGKDFAEGEPGPLFPPSWTPAFELARRLPGSAPAAGPARLRRYTGKAPVSLEDLRPAAPAFDKAAEDGTRFRVYRRGGLEVRTTQEPDGQEAIGAVFSTGAAVQLSLRGKQGRRADASSTVLKATEYVRAAEGRPDAGPRFCCYVVLETEEGATVLTEQQEDGTVSWEEAPEDLEQRKAQAKAVRSADCSKAGVSLRDVRAFAGQQAADAAGAGASQSARKRYAQAAYALASQGSPGSASSGFWQRSDGIWQLLRAPEGQRRGRRGHWEDGCWQDSWQGSWEGGAWEGWQGQWQGSWEADWHEEWASGWQPGQDGGRLTVAAAKLPSGAAAKRSSKLRRHFELQAALGLSDKQMAKYFNNFKVEALLRQRAAARQPGR